jgi:hypothetical protein
MSDDTFKLQQVNGNKADPLKDCDETRRELFGRFSKASNGFSQRDVIYAAVNLILNAVRQSCMKQKDAEAMLDEMMAHAKRTLLDQHYFPSGMRRNVFPFHQTIEAPPVDARAKGFGWRK